MNFLSLSFCANKYISRVLLIICLISPQLSADTGSTKTSATDKTGGVLVLGQALDLALQQNPSLAAFSKEIHASEAGKLQAGLLPNPVFSANASNFANSDYEGFDGDAVSLEISQLIELGGKRTSRVKVAGLAQDLANWDLAAARLDVSAQVVRAFIGVLAAQESLKLATKTQQLASKMAKTITALFKAGKVAAVEKIKAKVLLSTTQIELMRAEKNLLIARKNLAQTWGSGKVHFASVAGNLHQAQKPPPLAFLHKKLPRNPDFARLDDETNRSRALLELEEAKAIPDVTLAVGVNNNLIPDEYAMLASVSIPLPLFDQNQGNILAAEYRADKTYETMRYRQLRIKTALNASYQKLQMAYTEAAILEKEIIPSANSAYKIANKGYKLGKFDLLSLLDAQRTLFGAQKQQLQALADYHLANLQVARLTGKIAVPLFSTTE